MSDFILPLLLVVIVGSCVGAASGRCNARDAQEELDQLGKSVTELETAPLGTRVKFEGELEEPPRVVKSFIDERQCAAAYVRLSTVSETEDSDGDTETHVVVNFEARRSAEVLQFRRGDRRVAVRSNYWNPEHAAWRATTERWPAWAANKWKRDYRGSFRHFRIDQLCLQPSATYFVVGAVERVSDAARPDVDSVLLMEVAEPIIWLRPEPAIGPVEVWPGNENKRVGELEATRDFNRSVFRICGLVVLGGLVLGGVVIWRAS